MSLTRKVASNTLIQVIGKGFSTMLGLIVVAMITRHLGTAGFGQYTTVTTYLQFFGILVDFGLVLVTVQMISEHKAKESEIVNNLFTLRFFSALIFLGLAPIIALATPYPPVVKWGIALTMWSFFFITLNQILTGLFQKHLSMAWVAIAENVGRILLFLGTFAAIWFGKGLLIVLAAVVLGSFGQFVTMFLAARRFVKIKFAYNKVIWAEIITRAWPIGVSIAFNLVYLRADTLILTFVASESVVGLYGAAYRVLDILLMLPVMMMGVVLPILTHAWSTKNTGRFNRAMQKTFDVFMMVILPIFTGAILLATPLMAFIAGPEFGASGPILTILLIALIAAFVSTLFGHTVVALKHQKKVIWVYAIDAVLSLIGYIIFIPKYGMAGAAWVTVFSEAFAAFFLSRHVLGHTQIKLKYKTLGKIITASAIMYGALTLLPDWHVSLQIVAGAMVYGLVLFVTKGLPDLHYGKTR